jgi:hypothetical protein
MQRRHPHPSPWRRWLIGLAVLAFVGTQWLGLAHGVLHGTNASSEGAAHAGGLFAAGFGHDKGSPLCQLFDLAAHADAIASVPPALPLPPAQALPALALLDEGHAPAAAAPYSARAPPPRG